MPFTLMSSRSRHLFLTGLLGFALSGAVGISHAANEISVGAAQRPARWL